MGVGLHALKHALQRGIQVLLVWLLLTGRALEDWVQEILVELGLCEIWVLVESSRFDGAARRFWSLRWLLRRATCFDACIWLWALLFFGYARWSTLNSCSLALPFRLNASFSTKVHLKLILKIRFQKHLKLVLLRSHHFLGNFGLYRLFFFLRSPSARSKCRLFMELRRLNFNSLFAMISSHLQMLMLRRRLVSFKQKLRKVLLHWTVQASRLIWLSSRYFTDLLEVPWVSFLASVRLHELLRRRLHALVCIFKVWAGWLLLNVEVVEHVFVSIACWLHL